MTEPDAAELIRLFVHMQEQANEPMFWIAADISDRERSRLSHAVGHLILSIYEELMRPILRVYPELDPDKQDDSPQGAGEETASPEDPASYTTRRRLAEVVAQSVHAASADLERAVELVKHQGGAAEPCAFEQHLDAVRATLADLEAAAPRG
jgi:hypothetical protein